MRLGTDRTLLRLWLWERRRDIERLKKVNHSLALQVAFSIPYWRITVSAVRTSMLTTYAHVDHPTIELQHNRRWTLVGQERDWRFRSALQKPSSRWVTPLLKPFSVHDRVSLKSEWGHLNRAISSQEFALFPHSTLQPASTALTPFRTSLLISGKYLDRYQSVGNLPQSRSSRSGKTVSRHSESSNATKR